MFPNPLCTPDIVAAAVEALRRQATGSDGFYSEGTLIVFPPGGSSSGGTTEVALPVVNATTKLLLGEAQLTVSDCNITCPVPASGSAPTPSSPGVVVPVRDGGEFLAGLSAATGITAPQQTIIKLQGDVLLAPAAAAAPGSIPFRLGSTRVLEWRGAKGKRFRLDCGGISGLLFLEGGSTLRIADLNLTGLADSQWGSWPQGVDGPYIIQSLPLWPTISGGPTASGDTAFTVETDSMELNIVSKLCTQEGAAAQFAHLQQSAGGAPGAGFNYSLTNSAGFTKHRVDIASVTMQVPLLSAATKLGAGIATWSLNNTEAVCMLPEGSDDGTSSCSTDGGADGASNSGSGGPAPWVWGLVAMAAALAVAAGAVTLLLRRRRLRLQLQQDKQPDLEGQEQQQQQQQQGLRVLPTSADGSAPCSPGSAQSTSSSSSTLDSPCGTDKLSHPNDSMQLVHAGVWRSKVGFIDGLQFGALLGRGGFARVYRGSWRGSPVAVKVIETRVQAESTLASLHHEPLLSLSLSHPNVLPSYKSCIVRVLCGEHELAAAPNGTPDEGSGSSGSQTGGCGGSGEEGVRASIVDAGLKVQVMPPDAVLSPGLYEVWLVSELADKGSLADAMAAGCFTPPERHMDTILRCLLDIGRGLDYLHSSWEAQ
ncbi:hypothetical protein ABPG75_006020 [Micractinium tetrahymenae]